jgi:hypothetical protein
MVDEAVTRFCVTNVTKFSWSVRRSVGTGVMETSSIYVVVRCVCPTHFGNFIFGSHVSKNPARVSET